MRKISKLQALRGAIVSTISLAILFGFIDGNSMYAGLFFLAWAISEGIISKKKAL